MGLPGPFRKSCYTNQSARNPDPSRWEKLALEQFGGGYVLRAKYTGCTNFEGEKVMVFRGTYHHRAYLDPHFSSTGESPVARFPPTPEGLEMAIDLARRL
jgi:hypothetical protein